MTVTVKVLIPAKIAEGTQVVQYTANGLKALVDKFTATNYSLVTATLSVNIVTVSGTPDNSNLIVKEKAIQPGETYTFPELVGQALSAGDFISTIAGTASSLNIRANGREVT